MTGWNESELVGGTAPFPYWPDDDREMLTKRLEEEISGQHSAGGFQVRVKRKNGTLFDSRMYVSPLIDARGQQTGWMTSMTDITEPNRIREQLASAHDRFTIVLEALDASVSVAPLGSQELLFANKLYRLWFGQNTQGHLRLVAQAGAYTSDKESDDVDDLAGLPTESLTVARSENAEIFVPELGKWLEVRSRYINWADGRLAQMVIASDITPRRQAEELAAQQAERAQTASRLITMGEMASSVAHELNQPLTAISNYCSGMISRIKNKQVKEDDLVWALEKTAHQAQRAGQIILRIRSFVKRSEPNRMLSDVSAMVSESLELAEIELRRRHVRLSHYVAARLPQLLVDPILIEQVLINLMKNAAESIDNANRPVGQRHVELRVVPTTRDEQSVVEFSVSDSGQGLPPEVIDRVYEAFFSTKVEGMGIGLNLCRSIIESHQGRISAQNIYNADDVIGCRFCFWIPVHTTLTEEQPTEWLLEGKDYRVRCYDSAESFISRYDPREVACLIADIRMGGMTGLELQDRLIERRSPLPIVFITGHGDVPMAVNTMKKGAMDFIQKPFKEEELLGLVERMLDEAREAFAGHQQAASRDALLSKLTGREAQVLERIVAGRLNKQIADDLGISIKTVEAHRANIMEKLNANTVADLLKIALGQNAPKA
eukprot:gene18158-20679_t